MEWSANSRCQLSKPFSRGNDAKQHADDCRAGDDDDSHAGGREIRAIMQTGKAISDELAPARKEFHDSVEKLLTSAQIAAGCIPSAPGGPPGGRRGGPPRGRRRSAIAKPRALLVDELEGRQCQRLKLRDPLGLADLRHPRIHRDPVIAQNDHSAASRGWSLRLNATEAARVGADAKSQDGQIW